MSLHELSNPDDAARDAAAKALRDTTLRCFAGECGGAANLDFPPLSRVSVGVSVATELVRCRVAAVDIMSTRWPRVRCCAGLQCCVNLSALPCLAGLLSGWPLRAHGRTVDQMDPEEKEKMEKRDWLAEKIQMLNTQLEGFEADVEKAVSTVVNGGYWCRC